MLSGIKAFGIGRIKSIRNENIPFLEVFHTVFPSPLFKFISTKSSCIPSIFKIGTYQVTSSAPI
jgi:hypothetical protein